MNKGKSRYVRGEERSLFWGTSLKKAEQFKYLDMIINKYNNTRVQLVNKARGRSGCYYSTHKLLKSRLLSRDTKLSIH